ncbi:alpha/beta hydrolase [Gordonia sinesedis]
MKRRTWEIVGIAAATAGAAVVAAGLGATGVAMARAALGADPAVDDGPDDLLADPEKRPGRRVVTTPDGTRLNVETYSPDDADADTGDIVVLVHGWTCNTAYWNPQINGLAGKRTVVAYDQRGHGRSELGRTRPTVAMLGQDLNAVLEAVVPPGKRVILMGHSMGGMTIMSWAAQFPEKASMVSEVVLVSTAAKAVIQNHTLIPVDVPRYARPFRPAVSKLVTSAPLPLPHTAVGARFAHYAALGPHARASHVAFVDDMILRCPPRARARWGSAMGKLDLTEGLAALTAPTTVIVGTEDRLTPQSHAEQIADHLRRNGNLRDLVVLDDIGHMASIEAAERVNVILDDVIGRAGQAVPSSDEDTVATRA